MTDQTSSIYHRYLPPVIRATVLVSLFIHLVLLILAGKGYLSLKPEIEETNSRTYRVQLKQSKTESVKQEPVIVQPEVVLQKEKLEKKNEERVQQEKEEKEEKQKDESIETPQESEKINPLHNSSINASSNQTQKNEAKIVAGKRDLTKSPGERANEDIQPEEPPSQKSSANEEVALAPQPSEESLQQPTKTNDLTVPSDEQKISESKSQQKQVNKPLKRVVSTEQSNRKIETSDSEKEIVGGPEVGREERGITKAVGSDSSKPRASLEPSRREKTQTSLSEPKIPQKFLEKFGNLDMLDDGEMRETKIEEPFSKIESQTIQMVNAHLARMQKQVERFYQKPVKEMHRLRGIIRFHLDPLGYLQEAYIFLGSGDIELDVAALDAVRSVPRYAVPDNRILAERYYSVLNFYYSSDENRVDQAPWESEE